MMKWFCLRILLVLSLVTGFSVCDSAWASAPDHSSSANIAVAQWPGHDFTFLALADTRQADGYEIFKLEEATRGYGGDRSVRLPYANYVGKQVTVKFFGYTEDGSLRFPTIKHILDYE